MAQLQVAFRSNGTFAIDHGVNSVRLATFAKTREGEKIITLVAWYLNEYHAVSEVPVRTNGNAQLKSWLATSPVVCGIRFVEA